MQKRPFIIGLTGVSGSGKTTFIKELEKAFSEDQLCVISQDNYYKDLEDQEVDQQGITNFDLPQSIDHKAFAKDIEQLIQGQEVTRKEYTYNNPDIVPKDLVFKPCPIILLEGIFVFHYKIISDLQDLKVFLNTRESIALGRRIRRDRIERGYPLEDVLYRYEHHVLPTTDLYIRPFQELADIVINNNQDFSKGLQILIGFLKNQINE
ncbi:MAG: P-loop NTPase fold protein [Saprospiraceae bacterium]|nr:P-loop NTPase fold protein [Saprospiraceae bacterium]